jgi:hypothetical protein
MGIHIFTKAHHPRLRKVTTTIQIINLFSVYTDIDIHITFTRFYIHSVHSYTWTRIKWLFQYGHIAHNEVVVPMKIKKIS